MAIIAAQSAVKAGTAVVYSNAAGGGDSYQNSGKERLRVKNTDSSSHDVTLAAQANCAYGVNPSGHNVVKTLAAGDEVEFHEVDPLLFNDANGRVQITYTSATGMKVAVISGGVF